MIINVTCRSPITGQVKSLASCNCSAMAHDLAGHIPTANRADIQKRRAEEYKKHQARYAWPPVPGAKAGTKRGGETVMYQLIDFINKSIS